MRRGARLRRAQRLPSALVTAAALLGGCAPSRSWRPAPEPAIPPGVFPSGHDGDDGIRGPGPGAAAPAASESELALASTATAAAVEPDPLVVPELQVTVAFEAPYELDRRPVPTTLAAQRDDILRLRRWNDGGLGALRGEQPGPEGHPDPRVRVNIDAARGALEAATIQRIARQYHWINVVRCYQLGAYLDPTLRGWTRGRFAITGSGKVSRPRMTDTELEDRNVARCLLERLGELTFPRGRAATQVEIAIKVSPGDDPLPPPKEAIVPGDGKLTAEQMLTGVEPARAAFEACYRAGLEYAPELWGRIPIRFHVTEQGRLDEAFDNGGRFPDPRVKQCVLRAARGLRFARPEGGDTRFVVPLLLYTDRAAIPGLPASAAAAVSAP